MTILRHKGKCLVIWCFLFLKKITKFAKIISYWQNWHSGNSQHICGKDAQLLKKTHRQDLPHLISFYYFPIFKCRWNRSMLTQIQIHFTSHVTQVPAINQYTVRIGILNLLIDLTVYIRTKWASSSIAYMILKSKQCL